MLNSASPFLLFFALTAIRVHKGQVRPFPHESSRRSLLVIGDCCKEAIRTFLAGTRSLVEEAMAKMR